MKCSVKDCLCTKRGARGLCHNHYEQWRRRRNKTHRTPYDPNEIIIKGKEAVVYLYNIKGQKVAETIIDIEDILIVNKYKWRLSSDGYVVTTYPPTINKKTLRLHKLLCKGNPVVDHINRDKLDNRRQNLRPTTQSLNMVNSGMWGHNTSGIKGVSLHSDGKWRTYFCGKHLGLFKTVEEAQSVRKKAETAYFREFK